MIASRRTLRVRTPEGIAFELPLAGPVARATALAVDLACLLAVSGALAQLASFLNFFEPGFAQAAGAVLGFAFSVGYGILCEWRWRGQTLGKRLLRLQVLDEQGLPITFSQAALRNLLRCVDLLPACYLVGGISCLLTRRQQRLGDLAARTVVIQHRREEAPDVEQLLPGKFNSLLAHPHLVARLRQETSPAEAAVAAEAVLRRNRLRPEARLGLFAVLAAHFRERVAFPPDPAAELADEQYVRNVVHALFQARRTSGATVRPPPSPGEPPAPPPS